MAHRLALVRRGILPLDISYSMHRIRGVETEIWKDCGLQFCPCWLVLDVYSLSKQYILPVCFYPCQVAEHDESKVFMTIHTKKAAQSQVVDCTFIQKKNPPPPAKGCFIITCFSDGSSGAHGLVIVGGFKSTTLVNLRVEGSVKTIFEGTIPLLDKGSLPPHQGPCNRHFPR